MALHNAEEAITFPAYLGLVLAHVPDRWQHVSRTMTPAHLWTALLLLTVVPTFFATWATLRPNAATPVRLLLLLQGALLLNVVWHMGVAISIDGYTPGLITAVVVNLPASVYLLRRAVRERWWRVGDESHRPTSVA
jgi:nucleoside recognition membrane protein YjiH